jgi:hypothetical protein
MPPQKKSKLLTIKNIVWIIAGIFAIITSIVVIYTILNLPTLLIESIEIPN